MADEQAVEAITESSGLTVVLLGDLNPAILHPEWFRANGLLRPDDANSADIEVIAKEVAAFSLSWVTLQATPDRFQLISASAPSYGLVRDLAVGTFRLLSHTPIKAMGVNHSSHLKLASEDIWHAFGHKLTPKEIWDEILEAPGVRSLIMEGLRSDEYVGYVRVQVEPSVPIQAQGDFGIYISVNDHVQLDAMDRATGDEASNVLADIWDPATERSRVIIRHLMKQA